MAHALKRLAGTALLAGTAAFGSMAQAGPINPADPSSVTITFNNPIFTSNWRANVTLGGDFSGRVAAGRFTGVASDLVNVTEETFVDGIASVFMYCFDLLQSISAGQVVNYDITFSPDISRTLNFIGAVNHVLNTERGTTGIDFDPYAWVRPTNRAQSVAIQLGLWETKYDSTWDLSNGRFQTSIPNVASTALNEFSARYSDAANTSVAPELVMVLSNPDHQDMIAADPPTPAPAPATLGLLAFGLLMLARGRHRLQFAEGSARG